MTASKDKNTESEDAPAVCADSGANIVRHATIYADEHGHLRLDAESAQLLDEAQQVAFYDAAHERKTADCKDAGQAVGTFWALTHATKVELQQMLAESAPSDNRAAAAWWESCAARFKTLSRALHDEELSRVVRAGFFEDDFVAEQVQSLSSVVAFCVGFLEAVNRFWERVQLLAVR